MNRTGGGYVRIDPAALDAELLQRNMTETDLIDGGIGRASIVRIYAHERIQRQTARKLIQVLGLNPHQALHRFLVTTESTAAQSPNGHALKNGSDAETNVGPWRTLQRPTAWLTTSNQLQYRIFRMQHTLLPNLFGRGKCYDLTQFDEPTRERMTEALVRHPHVCRQLEQYNLFPRNEFAGYSDERHFWVIDREVTGETLQQRVEQGALEMAHLASVLSQLANAILVMHEHEIIRRELTPETILLEPNDKILLTDLELAKLTAERPSVSQGSLQPSRWLAPEIDAPQLDPRVDVYSWGKIFIYAATGKLPDEIIDPRQLRLVKLPRPVQQLVRQSLNLAYSQRPKSRQVVQVLQKWSPAS